MKGYKAFDKDLKCRGMQYEIGKVYEMDETPIPCERGFHFCKTIADCYGFYPMREDTRICEVDATGDVVTDDEVKYCTNKIKILAEVENPREKSNTSESSSGYCNSGYCNSGNRNSGDWNSGDWNSGDWNSGDWNSGIFCTDKNPKIRIFDADSDWTMDKWIFSRARYVMNGCPYTYSDFVSESKMTDEEKERHPEHKTIGGFVKVFVATAEDKQRWWDDLPEVDKAEIYKLPNFNAEKFEECVGVKIWRTSDDR